MRRRTTWLLLVAAGLHAVPAVYLALTDGGDVSLLWVAAPLMALTAAAAAAVGRGPLPAVLLSVALVLTLLLVPLYGVGLLHLPQALLAVVVMIVHDWRREVSR